MIQVISVLAVLLAILPAQAAPRSGHADSSPATQAMQDDDSQNPAFLWVQQGENLWSQPATPGGPSCATCHNAVTTMKGVSARYPAFDPALQRPVTLEQRINLCRTEHQQTAPLAAESDALLGLSALIGLQSRGMPLQVQQSGPMTPFHDAGEKLFTTPQGQLDLSCSQCHDGLAGRSLAGSRIPEGHSNGYPLYRLEWQAMGSLSRRIRNCTTGVRAEPWPPGSPELVALEVYLAGRAQAGTGGLTVETPAVRP